MRDGWTETTLGSHIKIVMGQAPPGKDCNKDGVGVPFVKAGEFTDGFPLVREWTTNPLKFSKLGDTLICVVGATCGKLSKGIDCAIGRSVAALQPLETLDGGFLFNFMARKVQEMRDGSRGSAQGVITKDDLADLPLELPPLVAQRRIVDVVSSVDLYIDALQQHAETARIALNAVLNELLSAGGDDWTKSTLGDIAQWQGGITPSMANNEFWENGTIPWVSSGDVLHLNLRGAQKFVTEISLKETSLKLLPVGAVVVVVRSGILIHTLPIAILESPSTINQDIKAGIPRSNVLGQFLLWVLRSNSRVILESCRKTGTTVQSISTDAFLKFPVLLPPLDEQKRIVEIVSSMNEVLQSAENAVAVAKNLRSGLLSDLLSGIHEIPESYDKFLETV